MKNSSVTLKYKLVATKSELILYQDDIFKLFLHSFNKELDDELWEWMYLSNPIGDALVSLCFDGDLLVGHYAAIQIPVKVHEKQQKAILSVGSMVHSSYRKYGVFVKQGEDVYSFASDSFFCVMGFPNKMALPSRKKRLSWTIDESDYVALVSKEQLVDCEEFNKYLQLTKDIVLDINRDDFLQWRMSKPKADYHQNDFTIIKKYQDNLDIVYLDSNYCNDLEDGVMYHILCDGKIESLRKYKAFDYPFGYRIFDNSFSSCTFKKDLIMSDVF